MAGGDAGEEAACRGQGVSGLVPSSSAASGDAEASRHTLAQHLTAAPHRVCLSERFDMSDEKSFGCGFPGPSIDAFHLHCAGRRRPSVLHCFFC